MKCKYAERNSVERKCNDRDKNGRFVKNHKFLGDLSKPNYFHKGMTSWNNGKKCPQLSGSNHHNWKGGKIKHQVGYTLVYNPEHPHHTRDGYVFEHRLIMEKHIGRLLKPKEIVHHINGNVSDNRIKNLMLFSSNSQHLRYHKDVRKRKKKVCPYDNSIRSCTARPRDQEELLAKYKKEGSLLTLS